MSVAFIAAKLRDLPRIIALGKQKLSTQGHVVDNFSRQRKKAAG
jgi:hypothetical protein